MLWKSRNHASKLFEVYTPPMKWQVYLQCKRHKS